MSQLLPVNLPCVLCGNPTSIRVGGAATCGRCLKLSKAIYRASYIGRKHETMTKEKADEVMRDEIAMAKRSLAMPTTGNEEQDDATLHDAARSTCMIAAGHCPNGCGPMTKTETGQECPACHFSYHGNL